MPFKFLVMVSANRFISSQITFDSLLIFLEIFTGVSNFLEITYVNSKTEMV